MRAAELNYHAWSDASTYVLHATVNRIYDSRERRKCMQILHHPYFYENTASCSNRKVKKMIKEHFLMQQVWESSGGTVAVGWHEVIAGA